ncbi:hypothetical protein R6Q57_007578 [Mikania cordata]
MTIEMKRTMSHLGNKSSCGYECRTCKKRFATFQALGGHQGSHKKVKFSDSNDALCMSNLDNDVPKLQQCKTCVKEFETGQALGGHMRRHRLKYTLNLIEKERLWKQRQVVTKTESDFVLAAVGLQWLIAEGDKRHEVKSELVLAENLLPTIFLTFVMLQ